MTFRDLPIGETFAFQPARYSQGRILRCRKISPRIYTVTLRDGGLRVAHITTIKVPVYQQGLTGIVYQA